MLLTQTAKPTVVVERVSTEFRASWRSREAELRRAIEQACNAASLAGLGQSGALLKSHQQLYESALDDARRLFLDTAESVFHVIRPQATPKLVSTLTATCIAILDDLASGFDAQLTERAKLIGLPRLALSVADSLQSLRATTDTAIGALVARYASSLSAVRPPWYQRPIGYVVLTVIATVIATVVTAWLLSR